MIPNKEEKNVDKEEKNVDKEEKNVDKEEIVNKEEIKENNNDEMEESDLFNLIDSMYEKRDDE